MFVLQSYSFLSCKVLQHYQFIQKNDKCSSVSMQDLIHSLHTKLLIFYELTCDLALVIFLSEVKILTFILTLFQ